MPCPSVRLHRVVAGPAQEFPEEQYCRRDGELCVELRGIVVVELVRLTDETLQRDPEPLEFRTFDGRWFITGLPGRRGWYANLMAKPAFTLHVKRGATADLPSMARPITDETERREVLTRLREGLSRNRSLDDWLAGSPLVEVTIEE